MTKIPEEIQIKINKNGEYWKERFTALEDTRYSQSEECVKDIRKQFEIASRSISRDILKWYQRLADNNNISLSEAMKLLDKNELQEFHWDVEEYIKAGKENAVDPIWMTELENASAKVHISRLEAMQISIRYYVEGLYPNYLKSTTEHLQNTGTEHYYRVAYEIAKGTGAGKSFSKLDERKLDAFLYKPWAQDGDNFSDRIWKDKDKLLNGLHFELSQNIIRGESPDKATKRIANSLQVSKKQAGRLIMTESAAISSAAQRECFTELEVEKYQIVATLDSSTSDICRALDGKVFKMTEYQVGLTANPFHPWCRTVTVPYFDDEFTAESERAARGEDGKIYYVPANMTYNEWKMKYVEGLSFEEEKSEKRNKQYSVNWNNVKTEEYRNKFKHASNIAEVQETLHSKAVDILNHREGTDYEDFYLIERKTGKVSASQTKAEYTKGITEESKHNRVWYNEEITNALKNSPKGSFITIHNHASSKPTSGGDFEGAFRNGYYAGINVCHNGDVYYYKVGKKRFSGNLFDATVEKYKSRGYNEMEAYENALNQFANDYGIEWRML